MFKISFEAERSSTMACPVFDNARIMIQREEIGIITETKKNSAMQKVLTTVFLLAIKFSRGSGCYIQGNMFCLGGWGKKTFTV